MENCNRKYVANGYCDMHRKRVERYNDPNTVLIITDHSDTCVLDECSKNYFCRGFCKKHYRRDYEYRRSVEDTNFRVTKNLRNRLRMAIKNKQKVGSAIKDLGCSINEFKSFIENQFEDGMSWDNYGEWHLDHIKPLSSFSLDIKTQFLEAVHHTNLQPLWAYDNISKGSKI